MDDYSKKEELWFLLTTLLTLLIGVAIGWTLIGVAIGWTLGWNLGRFTVILQEELSSKSLPSGVSFMEGNTLIAQSAVYYPELEVLASRLIEEDDLIDMVAGAIIYCESRGKHEGVWGEHGEYGIAQFKEKTFYWMAEKAGLKNADWKNKEHQIYLLKWALKNKLGRHWTCYKGELGY